MVCFAEVTHFDTRVAFVLPDQEFLFQRIQVFRHKDELPSGRILTFMILHGQAFFYPSVSTFIIASILVFIAGLSSIFFETEHNPVSVRIFGAILSVAGTAIFIVAVWTMRDSWRAGVSKTDKTELVTNGIYQISRNPAFLGFDLLYIGTLLMFFNWILCFLTVFAVIMYHLQIVNVEEDFLFATFGNEYLQYKKKVCRYIGRKR